jgi:hypothetical protein
MKHKKYIYSFALYITIWAACQPSQIDDINIGPLPEAPEFELVPDPDNPNRIIARDLSQGFFNRLWVAPGSIPRESTASIDTFFYINAGEYTITLYAAKQGGSGTSQRSQTIIIENDATLDCDGSVALLTGDCAPDGKCWKFSNAAGAIRVGPTYGSGEWYSSPANGLVPEQVNARWCFVFQDFDFQFLNNGVTINPWEGYVAVEHTPTPGPWLLSSGTGMEGVDQIILSPGQFMGTWDSDRVLDIALLTEDMLVVRTRLVDRQGNPAAQGWFEFTFVAD